MADYCLTTWVLSGSGTISQPGCSTPVSLGGTPCAYNYAQGTLVDIIASPDISNGWEIGEWYISDVSALIGMSPDNTVMHIRMLSGNVDVNVSFTHDNINLKLEVYEQGGGEYGGCINLISPIPSSLVPCHGGTVSVPVTSTQNAVALAEPDTGWEVDKWYIDGELSQTGGLNFEFDIATDSNITVTLYFKEIVDCSRNTLNVTVVGSGAVTPQSGEYCDYLTLSLHASPSKGYVFDRWEYSGSGFVVDGDTLLVNMSADRSVTAYFDAIPGWETEEYQVFYCPSITDLSNVVSFDFTNDIYQDPSVENKFHFRIKFYSDMIKQNLLYTAFSSWDSKRWFYEDSFVNEITNIGASVSGLDTIKIIYDPDIIPNSLTKEQKSYYVDGSSVEEIPLLCGVKYYVDIDVYDVSNTSFEFLESKIIIFPCGEDDDHLLYENKDVNNWISSGNGKDDLKITETEEGALFPSINSNLFGYYNIAWQSNRDTHTNIYGAIWDSNEDTMFSSGQGYSDVKYIQDGYRPTVLVDQSNNFPIIAHDETHLLFYNCPLKVSVKNEGGDDGGGGENNFEKFCLPTSSMSLPSGFGSIVARVYEEDQISSLVINPEKVLPVIDKQTFRIEVEGANSAYAVRLRDSEDSSWGEWMNINGSSSAYKVDDHRFIVSWTLSRINGIRRVCLQILTLYGISSTICIELYLNQDIVEYTFKFYKDSDYKTLYPIYNGYYIIPETENAYFEVIFNESVSYTKEQLSYNIFQQGIDDVWGQSFTEKVGGNIFRGNFKVYKHDNVFKKDGKAFIQIIFPEDISSSFCSFDSSDKYNLMLTVNQAQEYQDMTPEEIYEKEKTNKTSKAIDIIPFRQYYNQDDANYLFGNPAYFRND